MTTRTPLMAGNWKMNLDYKQGLSLVEDLGDALKGGDTDAVEVAVIPPFVDIRTVQTAIDANKYPIAYGAQDLSEHIGTGAYTGEVSGEMLTALGCTYVLVGHSERRQYHGEDENITNAKVKAAIAVGLTPILCVGEGLDERKAGKQVEYTLAQLEGGLEGLSNEDAGRVVIAYEPVWAIGTGEVATPEDAQEVCGAIRDALGGLFDDEVKETVRVLYGGSVKSSNVGEIMAKDDVDGALVGGASLKADEFAKIALYQG
ncbi:triose-phosphate isomerase [Brachybacterium huguangmaarense]|uniref:Triosephosphate isomerase n=1 Tax=Brachybacterium huguangmaarense TaxID=1652028 RepID=A0ABY6FZM8_9MICO|nr:triose-phosphate isomerase [Brachybacterium huguangmaarense]UYG16401.1 triose-phosphate isomerase [Brachybacterium huguangmaarense]